MGYKYSDAIAEAEKSYGVGGGSDSGGWYELTEGMNTVRILSWSEIYPSHYSPSGYKGICLGKDNGCPGCKEDKKPGIKWLTWVSAKEPSIDDAAVMVYSMPKLAKFPHSVLKKLQTIQEDPDYAFDSFPMPYDIKIFKKKTGNEPTDVEYDVVPGKEYEIPAEVLANLQKQNDPGKIRQAMKEKKAKELGITLTEKKAEVESLDQAAQTSSYPEPEEVGINPEDIPF